MKTLDMAWGNPYFLLNTLSSHRKIMHSYVLTKDCSYGPDVGDTKLINVTRNVIQHTTGLTYKHILITHGATGAINSVLRFLKSTGVNEVRTGKFGYPFYDTMISKAGLVRRKGLVAPRPPHNSVALIDSPSNPEGDQTLIGSPWQDVWDSVYHSDIYTDDLKTIPGHAIMVGSYSKLLGVTGARIGWIATNDKPTYDMLFKDTLHELATISLFSQQAIVNLMDGLDLDLFMNIGKQYLNNNREDMQKIEYIFDGQPVQKSGMFYFVQANKTSKALLEKCSVKYVDLGDNHVRLNMGQTHDVVKQLIYRIHKEDQNG